MDLQGKPDFEKYHTRLLSGRFKDSTITPLQTEVRFLRPDISELQLNEPINIMAKKTKTKLKKIKLNPTPTTKSAKFIGTEH